MIIINMIKQWFHNMMHWDLIINVLMIHNWMKHDFIWWNWTKWKRKNNNWKWVKITRLNLCEWHPIPQVQCSIQRCRLARHWTYMKVKPIYAGDNECGALAWFVLSLQLAIGVAFPYASQRNTNDMYVCVLMRAVCVCNKIMEMWRMNDSGWK